MDVGLVTAFLGGALALLSPCGALLLPAFFASTLGSGPRLWLHGGVFYVGLLFVLVPLGIGAGALGSLFVAHRSTIIGGAAILLVVLGVAQVFGFGFDLARVVPGAEGLRQRSVSGSGLVKTLFLGAASGLAGFCAGPILGAVLTLAAAQGNALGGSILLATYGAGMVVPLLLIAASWGRLGARAHAVLRGRTFTVAGREFHTTTVITGLLIAAVGVLFWVTNGLVGLPQLLPDQVADALHGSAGWLSNPIVDVLAIGAVAALVLGLWWWRRPAPSETDA